MARSEKERRMTPDELLSECVYAIEADDFARHVIWKEMRDHRGADIELHCPGIMKTLGYADEMPVVVQITFGKYRGKIFLYYHATSQVVDWRMVNKYIRRTLNLPTTDARNYWNAFNGIDKIIDGQPWQKTTEEGIG